MERLWKGLHYTVLGHLNWVREEVHVAVLGLLSGVERPEAVRDLSHFGEAILTGGVEVSVVGPTEVRRPQGHAVRMDAASRVTFFGDSVARLECTHGNLRIPVASEGPLIDVRTADQDVIVIKDLK